jgi:hypothetical protein
MEVKISDFLDFWALFLCEHLQHFSLVANMIILLYFKNNINYKILYVLFGFGIERVRCRTTLEIYPKQYAGKNIFATNFRILPAILNAIII